MAHTQVQEIHQVEKLSDSDSSIFLNISTQVIISTIMFLVFICIRQRNLWLYSPNTRNKRNHPAFSLSSGFLSWILPVLMINDVDLLSMVGLDAFMMLQVFKLLYRCFFILCVILIPLFFLYYKAGLVKNERLIFLRFNIDVLKGSRTIYISVFYVYLITFFLFYLIYVYYKKYITLRQTYLRSPALLTSLSTLKRISFALNGGDYVNYVNIKSRTVLLSRIPSFVENDADLRLFVDALGCGVVDECVLLKDLHYYDGLVDKQDVVVRDLEGEIERSFRNIVACIKKNKNEEDFKELYKIIVAFEKEEKRKHENDGFYDNTLQNNQNRDGVVKNRGEKKNSLEMNNIDPNNNVNTDSNKNNDIKLNNTNEKLQSDDNKFNSTNEKLQSDNKFNSTNEKLQSDNKFNSTNEKLQSDNKFNSTNEKSIQNDSKELHKSNEKFQSDDKKLNDKKLKDNNENADPNRSGNNQIDNYSDNIHKQKISKDDLELLKGFIYSKNKYIKKYKDFDSIIYKLSQIQELHDKIVDHVQTIDDIPEEVKTKDNIVEMMNINNKMFTKMEFNEDIPFFSCKQILHFKKNYHFFSLDLPLNTRTAFVTFTEPKAANIICQSLISSKIFSCKADPAPDPDDIIWENINRSEVESYFKNIIGNIIFIVFCLIFYVLVFSLTSFIRLEKIVASFPSLAFLDKVDAIKSTFDSIVVPGCYNIILSLAPFILTILIYYQGVYSYSLLYLKLLIKYGYFLLFNGFIALLVSGTFISLIKKLGSGDFILKEFITEIGENLKELSLFFVNTIIQRIFVGNMLIILKPVKFFLVVTVDNFMACFFKSVRSRRSKIEAMRVESINFGVVYPIILIVFPMAISYAIISPPILIVAGVYFYTTYFVYKHEFIYCLGNDNEAGGVHWVSITDQLIIGITVFHILTICQFTSIERQLEALCITPILVITYMFKQSLSTMFKKSTTHYPLNEQEEQYMDKFTQNVINTRKGIVENWDESLDPEDPDDVDLLYVIEREKEMKDTNKREMVKYPYRGIIRGINKIMLPKGFFNKLGKIKEKDSTDKLEIFKEEKKIDNKIHQKVEKDEM